MLEDQDLGTFRATTPERGGFLYPDGSPISLAELADATPENAVDLPIDTDEITPHNSAFFLRILFIFAIMMTVVALSIYWLISHSTPPATGDVGQPAAYYAPQN